MITDISVDIQRLCKEAEQEAANVFNSINEAAYSNSVRVLNAMRDNGLSATHMDRVTGYGYDDAGRNCLERIYADVMGCESSLVRPQIISGTHALYIALSANLKCGDELLSVAGAPYDTLLSVIGINKTRNSLIENGIVYKQANLTQDGDFDYESVRAGITEKTKIAFIQRSRGYAWRGSFSTAQIERMRLFIKKISPDTIVMVDNCYGEFTETEEPRADIIVGSLIKNPGGGLAETGGYIAGNDILVRNAADRLTAPGLGKEIGPGLGIVPNMLKGLFIAPEIVASALKGAVLCAYIFETLGYSVLPRWYDARSDIVQSVRLGEPGLLKTFCEAVQASSPVDSFVTPVPAPMPGYKHDVIMAAGTFTQGSSVELSADGPMREPFTVYFQGGLTYHHAKTGVMLAASRVLAQSAKAAI